MLPFLRQRYEFPYVRCYGIMFEDLSWRNSVGTVLRAFGLSGDQTFVFGLQFYSGNPLFFFITNSLGWISLPPLLS